MSNSEYNQWQVREDGVFFPSYETTHKLPAGVYEIRKTPREEFYLKKQNVISDGIIDIPMAEMQGLVDDMKKFWSLEEEYRNSHTIFKRGILLYGPAGTGKSIIIQRLIQNLIKEEDGIVINISSCDEIESYSKFCPEILRVVEPNRKMLVIMEELDSLLWRGHIDIPSIVKNILDGLHSVNNVVYIASTNHISKLDSSLTNRPSRFDVKLRVSPPGKEARKYFLQQKLNAEQLKLIDLHQWVEETEGFSIAHLKELIISVLIMKHDFTKTIGNLRRMKDFVSSREESGVEAIGY